MPFLDTLSKMTTASGRAYLTLLRADRFAVGHIGATAQISTAQRALELLLRKRAMDTLLELQERASLPGQLYALLGLSATGHPRVGDLLATYQQRKDKVKTQTACFISSQPVCDIVSRIEDGKYFGLLEDLDTDVA